MSATVVLKGGIGNQLFQIFSCLGICKTNDYNFYLDKNLPSSSVRILLNKLLDGLDENYKLKPMNVIGAIKEQRFSQYCRVVLDKEIAPHVLFTGYFQSFFYFEKIRNLVFDHLLHNQDSTLMEQVQNLYNEIQTKYPNKKFVFVHRRKGDYKDSKHNGYFAILSLKYYRKAFAEFDAQNTCFVIFSDEVEDTKQEFNEEFPNVTKHYVENQKDYIELLLMSRMDGAIIANSTFSCWAAYLMDFDRNKKVVSPKYWYSEWNIHRLDFLEKHWKLIENKEVYEHVQKDPKR